MIHRLISLPEEELQPAGSPVQLEALASGHQRVYISEEVIEVPAKNSKEMVPDGSAHEERNDGKCPWEIYGLNGKNEDLHAGMGVPAGPYVGDDIHERPGEEVVRYGECEGYEEQQSSGGEEHVEEIG